MRKPEEVENKLAKMECSESLAPQFVTNDHVTAEVIYSTVHACHKVLGCGLLCAVNMCELHLESGGI